MEGPQAEMCSTGLLICHILNWTVSPWSAITHYLAQKRTVVDDEWMPRGQSLGYLTLFFSLPQAQYFRPWKDI